MGSSQYREGTVKISNASAVWIGDGTDWKNELSLPIVVKIDLDGESTYSVSTIISATRMITSANYGGTTGSGLDYMAMQSYTSRSYWRPLQGDSDFAEILSQETIDKIDDDVSYLFGSYSTGSAIGTNASSFAINMDATLGRFWTDNLTASRDYRMPDANATLAGLGVEQEFSADQAFNASVRIKGNASIDGALSVGTMTISNLTVDDINATTGDINTLHSATLTANNLNASTGDINTLHSSTLTADNLNATTGDVETLHSTTFNASNITASSMVVSDLTDNRIVVAGANGELEDDGNLTWDGDLLTVNGNMTITGSTVIVTASNISVKDPLIVLAKDQTGAPTYDSGLIVERGDAQNVGMLWDESADEWVMAYTDEDGTTSGNVNIASYGDLRVNGFQAENVHAIVFTASTYTAMTRANASIDVLQSNVTNINASIASNDTDITRANASIDTLQADVVRANASIDVLQGNVTNINASISSNDTDITRANASIDILQADVVRVNASIVLNTNGLAYANASIVHINASISRSNASIDALQLNTANNAASIFHVNASISRSNASIDALQANVTNINASITTVNASIDVLQSDVININASVALITASMITKYTFNAKGDILTASADNTPHIVTIGGDNTVLTADSTTISGVKWSVPAGGGDVVGPASNDTNYIPQWDGADSKLLKNGFAKTDLILQPNPVLKTANYQILTTDNMILASGNITITLASASAKHSIKLGNRSLDSNASILIKKSGGDTIESNASLNLANKYDTVCLVGDGVNTHFQF